MSETIVIDHDVVKYDLDRTTTYARRSELASLRLDDYGDVGPLYGQGV